MTYLQILNTIKDTALAQPNVNSVVREFLDLNREDAKYSAVVIQDRDGTRDRIVENDYITYTWHLGYVDRLTYDGSNRDDIISTGINVINNIVNTIRNTWFPELEVSVVDRINTFDQRFTAQCAGVYVVLAVNAQVSDCVDSESTDLYDTYEAKITANGVYHFVPTGRPVDEINITVDVAGAGKEEVELRDTVTMNGTHTYIPEEDQVYNSVAITVDVAPEWGSITGNISDQTDLIDYLGVMTSDIKSWVSDQGYLTEHQDLSSYATQSWVTNQGYITSVPDTFATKSWVESQGYLTEHQDLSSYATQSWVESKQFATQSWVSSQGYTTLSDVQGSFLMKSNHFGSIHMNFNPELGYIKLFDEEYEDIVEVYPDRILMSNMSNSDFNRGVNIKTSKITLTDYSTSTTAGFWINNFGTGAEMGVVNYSEHRTDYVTINPYSIFGTISDIDYAITISDIATQSWVSAQGYITSTGLSGLATQSWVESNFLSSVPDTFATKSWVESQGYLTSTGLSGLATQSWVESNFLSTTALDGYATQSWVESQGYITSVPDTFATKSWVESQGYLTEHQSLDGYATESWVESQGYLTSNALNGYATQSWVSAQGYLTEHQDLSSYATQSWVSSHFLTSTALSGYATQSWVTNQGYITSVPDTFATKSWVSSQGYLTSNALSGYATQSWVSNQLFYYTTTSEYAALQSRVQTLEDNYGDAVTITNQILG